LTDEQIHAATVYALKGEEFKETRRLGKDFEARRIEAKAMIEPFEEGEAVVNKNVVSHTNSLSQVEWMAMEAAMPAEERLCHRNLAVWMNDRAKQLGVTLEKTTAEEEEEEEEEEDPELLKLLNGGGEGGEEVEDEEEEDDKEDAGRPAAAAQKKKDEEEDAEQGEIKKDRNWSAVNCAFKESKLSWRGGFTQVAFTNWLWFRCVRPKLEDTKSKLPELTADNLFGIEDVDAVFDEISPAIKELFAPKVKKDEKDDKKEKKDKDGKKRQER